ncbi:hypothetical protein AWB68_04305 [Caballeronia choica]|uniref:Uncharacterized protein n=1 Tax=Caballeronia choica TaxID=326476 RepID=A0A158JV03_9BURK|nr:hypothetical protein AWB68_04305 [Caballeronia choica]
MESANGAGTAVAPVAGSKAAIVPAPSCRNTTMGAPPLPPSHLYSSVTAPRDGFAGSVTISIMRGVRADSNGFRLYECRRSVPARSACMMIGCHSTQRTP